MQLLHQQHLCQLAHPLQRAWQERCLQRPHLPIEVRHRLTQLHARNRGLCPSWKRSIRSGIHFGNAEHYRIAPRVGFAEQTHLL